MNEFSEEQKSSGGRRYSRRKTAWTFVILGVCVMIFGFGLAFPWLDSLKQEWVRCEVVSAEPQRGSNFNTAAWFVSVETTECGFISYQEDTTEENVDKIANSFEPGVYEFKVGMMSQLAVDDKFFGRAASAKDFRRVE